MVALRLELTEAGNILTESHCLGFFAPKNLETLAQIPVGIWKKCEQDCGYGFQPVRRTRADEIGIEARICRDCRA